MTIIAFLFLFFYCIVFFYTINKISKGEIKYLILYICTCLPIYITLQAQLFNEFSDENIINIIKLSKDLIFLFAFIVFLFGNNNPIVSRTFKFSLIDKLILLFTIFVTVYALSPIGEADLLSRLIYAKNLYIISITYLIGRNVKIDDIFLKQLKKLLNV